jgi:lipoprotein-releasing system permease protein
MYKLLLCWRYLRTRYIALASIISVMLGVATMIVVNAVMAGFSHEMEGRMHDILSDVVIDSREGLAGFPDADLHMESIRRLAGQWIEGMTPTVHVPAILSFEAGGTRQMHPIVLIGIDEKTYDSVSDFKKYLNHPENRRALSFDLHDGGYDTRDHQSPENAPLRPGAERWGWPWRQMQAQRKKAWEQATRRSQESEVREKAQLVSPGNAESGMEPSLALDPQLAAPARPADASDNASPSGTGDPVESAQVNPFAEHNAQNRIEFDAAKQTCPGRVMMGIAIASYRDHGGVDRFFVQPGDDVQITFPKAGVMPDKQSESVTIVDFYESKMSEYDSTFVFVPIAHLQEMLGMIDPATKVGNVSTIQIKLKPGVDPDMVRDILRDNFRPELYGVYTWRDKQGALLAAVQMERTVLNILLFFIIAVAGFGILAIFFMIVVEKTRDVGILKSLGASSRGILGIFLGYGLSLGIVGAGVGLTIGLLFVSNINQIRDLLEHITGQPVFDPAIYYFYKIPTIIDPFTVFWIMAGALSIAVLASVLPALRAARLHPVEALRYE